jgi:hypothetical protein
MTGSVAGTNFVHQDTKTDQQTFYGSNYHNSVGKFLYQGSEFKLDAEKILAEEPDLQLSPGPKDHPLRQGITTSAVFSLEAGVNASSIAPQSPNKNHINSIVDDVDELLNM